MLIFYIDYIICWSLLFFEQSDIIIIPIKISFISPFIIFKKKGSKIVQTHSMRYFYLTKLITLPLDTQKSKEENVIRYLFFTI